MPVSRSPCVSSSVTVPRLRLRARVPECPSPCPCAHRHPSPLLQALSPTPCPQVYLGAVFLGSCPGVCVPRCPSMCSGILVPPHRGPLPAVSLLCRPTSGLLQGRSCRALPAAAPVPRFPCAPSPRGGVLTPTASPPWGRHRTPQAAGGRRCHSRKKGHGKRQHPCPRPLPARPSAQACHEKHLLYCPRYSAARPFPGALGGSPSPLACVPPHPPSHHHGTPPKRTL